MKNYQCLTCGVCSGSLKLAREHKWITSHGKFIIRSIEDIAIDCIKEIEKVTKLGFQPKGIETNAKQR